ncbi:MAG: DUF488 family protein [Nitrososphaera sp.]|uniref:DUF488 domain-containing protein n=1 Tax=Nitrososphaera gargensis (strain Ga9.2) TaxID=1237085 RepID=K0IIQ4_NITGG|nr:DUF488 family protein [Candidatus Nitrososphaera gargensis]AFU59815.1 hypothetical protein Ngar_c28960 [Candidatus Nitrososphaera gargensis Ga9.2]
MTILTKRVYDLPSKDDGYRILVDRLWPRGISKSDAEVDMWLKDVAPSDSLRRWFNHRPERWGEFKSRYFQEFAKHDKKDLLQQIRTKEAEVGVVTLLYGAKDQLYNNAVALKEYLERTA